MVGVCTGGACAANSSWNAHLDASSLPLFRIFIGLSLASSGVSGAIVLSIINFRSSPKSMWITNLSLAPAVRSELLLAVARSSRAASILCRGDASSLRRISPRTCGALANSSAAIPVRQDRSVHAFRVHCGRLELVPCGFSRVDARLLSKTRISRRSGRRSIALLHCAPHHL